MGTTGIDRWATGVVNDRGTGTEAGTTGADGGLWECSTDAEAGTVDPLVSGERAPVVPSWHPTTTSSRPPLQAHQIHGER